MTSATDVSLDTLIAEGVEGLIEQATNEADLIADDREWIRPGSTRLALQGMLISLRAAAEKLIPHLPESFERTWEQVFSNRKVTLGVVDDGLRALHEAVLIG